MPTRIEIELTSAGADGSWTWRAAGAREPRGTLDGAILPEGAAVGDQLKVESEKDIDGIRILSIVQPKQKNDREGLLELLPSGDFEPVIQQRATRDRHEGGRGRPRRDRGERGDRGDRERGDRRGPRRDGEGGGEGRERRGPRREGEGGERRHSRPHFTPPPELPQRPKPKRLRPGKQRRSEVLAGIPEEQRPVAELALQGMAAVRQRLREDNARLRAESKPEMPEATVLKMAENLLPQLRVADWLDRAEAAKRQLAHLDLRDLRSVVASSDDPLVARDETTRELAAELKGALVTKQDEELNLWLSDVEAAVEVGRVVRALRLSAMPPKAGVPFPHQLGVRLGEVTTSSLSPEDPADRWVAVLEAAAFSPVRTLVTPAAAPAPPAEELVATVTRLAPLLPQIAALFGIEVPEKAPTPKPLRPTPRKKEAPKADARQGKTSSHPGPKREEQPAARDAAVAAEAAEADAEVIDEAAPATPEAAAPEADVAEAVAPDPEVVEAPEPAVTEAVAPEPEVADAPEPAAPEAEVTDAPEPAPNEAADAPEPKVNEAAAPEAGIAEVADAPEPAAPEAEVADAPEPAPNEAADAPEPKVNEAAAPEAGIAEVADAPEPAAPEAEVADAPEPAAPEAEVADASEPEVSEAAAPEADVAEAPDAPEPEG